MRKLIVAVIAVLYLGVSSGAVVTIHQCMGKLSSVSLSKKDKPCKCSKTAKKKMACCKSESKLVKIQSDHQQSQDHFQFFNTSVAVINPLPGVFVPVKNTDHVFVHTDTSPPLIHSKLYIAYNVFRI